MKRLQDYEKIHEGGSFTFFFQKFFFKNHWQKFLSIFTWKFPKLYLNGYFPMKLLLQERVKNGARTSEIEVSNYKGSLRSLFKFNDKKPMPSFWCLYC